MGLSLILCGLLAKHLYKLFDPTVRSDWYFQGAYWFLWTIRLQMKDVLLSIGVFLLFPVKVSLRWIMLLNMFAAVMEIVHYYFYTVSFETFHQDFSWDVILIGITLPIFLLFVADYMAYRKYHLKYGPFATIMGIVETPDVDDTTKVKSIKQSGIKIQDFYARY